MDRETFVRALRTSVKEFERLRKERPWPDMDLSGADLSNCDLRMVQLGRITLRNVDFSNSDLTGANLTHSDLRGARFHGARIYGVNLHKADLAEADFRGCLMGGMDEEGRMCINKGMFKNVRWGKEQLEYFLGVLNENDDWEIEYRVVPRKRG